MSESSREHLLDHEYDGIREYDNPTPAWWSWIFLGTFIFSILYFFFFQYSPVAWTNDDLYRSSVAANLQQRFSEIGDLAPDEATLLTYMNEPEWLTVGETVFSGQCVQCHASDAAGGVGPNLTDDLYKNVKTITDIAKVISEGANNGAMPAWGQRLHVNEIVLVSSYVATLRGKNLVGPGIDGEVEIEPWPAPPTPQETVSEANSDEEAGA